MQHVFYPAFSVSQLGTHMLHVWPISVFGFSVQSVHFRFVPRRIDRKIVYHADHACVLNVQMCKPVVPVNVCTDRSLRLGSNACGRALI